MDNITHSLFGAAVSESVWCLIPDDKKDRYPQDTRKSLFITSVIANNIPDVDVFYSGWMHVNRQLGNLLHHRGHTHTIPFSLLLSLFLLGGLALGSAKKRTSREKQVWGLLSLVALLGPLIHILLDGVNNYGVHPFWPWDPSWKYGDLIFVLEPWAWVSISVFLYSLTKNKRLRNAYLAVIFSALGLSWLLGVVPPVMSSVLSIWALLVLILLKGISPVRKTVIHWISFTVLIAVFVMGANKTRTIIQEALIQEGTAFKIEDLSISPLPVNPFCWSVVTSETNATKYRLRRGMVTPFENVVPLSVCANLRFFSAGIKNPPKTTSLIWEQEKNLLLSELRELREQYCDVRDFLKFARTPFFWRQGTELYVSDFRFERGDSRSFSRIKISSRQPPCADPRAPWTEPRSKLFFQ